MTGTCAGRGEGGGGAAALGALTSGHGFDSPALAFLTPGDVAHYVADMSYDLARMAHSRGHGRLAQLLTIVWAEARLTAQLPQAGAGAAEAAR